MDLATLKQDILDYTHRTDYDDARLMGFIEKAYAALNDQARLTDMEQRTTLTLTGAEADLPADFLEARSVVRTYGEFYEYELAAVSAAELGRYAGSGSEAAVYATYDGKLEIAPTGTAEVALTYYGGVPVPTQPTDTDLYLTRFPDMLLDACLEQAGKFNQDAELRQNSRTSWMAQVDMANRQAARTRLGSRSRATRPYQQTRGVCAT